MRNRTGMAWWRRRPLLLTAGLLLAALLLAQHLGRGLTFALDEVRGQREPADQQRTQAQQESAEQGSEPLAICRYGLTTGPGTSWILDELGAGVFYRWEADWPDEALPENDAELLRMIRARQRKTSSGEYLQAYYTNVPLNQGLADIILSDPGAVWMIGNEPERGPNPGETWSPRTDDMFPDMYAVAYHDIYHFIKGIDPTARIANAGMIQVTPMRLQYLDKVWAAYERKYGVPMPVDLWTIHTYVLPELTVDGQPNNIASVANGTDPALGKRASGGSAALCSDEDVYCKAEHDDVSLLEEQIVAMRQWMKAHGQQDKPLVVTEYGTLYEYRIKEDGSCGIRDENGECFTPERVSAFMLETFDYFDNANDAELGMPADEGKMVQQWIWYGAWNWDIASADLLLNDQQTLSLMGETFRDHVFAEPTYVNLVVDKVTGRVVGQDENESATAELTVTFRNNGNIAIEKPFTVTFYEDANLTRVIDSAVITPTVRGCATRAYSAKVEWPGLDLGQHPFWVKIDSGEVISEPTPWDNIGEGLVSASEGVYTLDMRIISEGEGVGGSVSLEPAGPAYEKGTVVSLTAVPFEGWNFVGWQGALIGSYPIAAITMNNDVTVEAHFLQETYDLEVTVLGQGDVKFEPDKDRYVYGDEVTLSAVPAPGWRFKEWRGDTEEDQPVLELSVKEDYFLQAVFARLRDAYIPLIAAGH